MIETFRITAYPSCSMLLPPASQTKPSFTSPPSTASCASPGPTAKLASFSSRPALSPPGRADYIVLLLSVRGCAPSASSPFRPFPAPPPAF